MFLVILITHTTIMYNMEKMNGLKIFALVILSLSKFETMFGMEADNNEDNIKEEEEYLNKIWYLIDDLGNKITLDDDRDIKFKFLQSQKALAPIKITLSGKMTFDI